MKVISLLIAGSLVVGLNAFAEDTTTPTTPPPAPTTTKDPQEAMARILAEKSGKSVDEVMKMRKDGKGWGEIAKTLGVHPGELGHAIADERHERNEKKHEERMEKRAERREARDQRREDRRQERQEKHKEGHGH